MRTLLRMDTGFSARNFRLSQLSTNSSQSSLHKPTMTGSSKKWFTPSFHTSSSMSKKKSTTNTSPSTQSQAQNTFQQPSDSQTFQSQPQASSSHPPQSQDRPPPPTYNSSMPTSSENQKPSKRSKAWKKTKKFLASIGEPPTAEYDRQQAALRDEEGKVKTSGREAFGAVNYGPYHQGGPYQAGGRL